MRILHLYQLDCGFESDIHHHGLVVRPGLPAAGYSSSYANTLCGVRNRNAAYYDKLAQWIERITADYKVGSSSLSFVAI